MPAKAATAQCPDDGTTVETLIGAAPRRPAHRSRAARRAVDADRRTEPIVLDPAMRRVYTLVERIADTPMTVLILGETGVGKEGRRRGDPPTSRAAATSR